MTKISDKISKTFLLFSPFIWKLNFDMVTNFEKLRLICVSLDPFIIMNELELNFDQSKGYKLRKKYAYLNRYERSSPQRISCMENGPLKISDSFIV